MSSPAGALFVRLSMHIRPDGRFILGDKLLVKLISDNEAGTRIALSNLLTYCCYLPDSLLAATLFGSARWSLPLRCGNNIMYA